jgi:hypothetical protein
MNLRRRFPTITSSLCGLALLCAAAGAPAQTIYKQVDSAGRVTFTDRPDSSLPSQAMTGAAPEAPRAPASITPMTAQRSAAINANEAGRRLAQAQLMRSEGADLARGDWTHSASTAVPNQRYWQRQERLRVLVEQAQRRATETRQQLLARS